MADNQGTSEMVEERKCAWCGKDTSFMAHAPNMCLSCGDRLQSDPVHTIKCLAVAVARVQELEATVSKTADGVPAQHGMTVYLKNGDEGTVQTNVCGADIDGVWFEGVKSCYSTRKAAEVAKNED